MPTHFSINIIIAIIASSLVLQSFQAVQPVNLHIKLFDVKNKRSTTLDDGWNYTVGEVKRMLVREIDTSGHILRLYFEGQELWIPDRTLASYHVRPGDTVTIYLENIAEQLAIRFGNQDKSPDGRLATDEKPEIIEKL